MVLSRSVPTAPLRLLMARRSLVVLLALLSLSGCDGTLWPDERPNILLIVADDLGYADLGAFGGEIPTPHLDRLAREGLQMTQFHVAATCSPTRAMLLTGVDHHRAGLGGMGELLSPNQRGAAGYEGHLNDSVTTLAERLSEAGYFTAMAGKWHLGLAPEQDPSQRGFAQAFTLLPGGASHFDLTPLTPFETIAPYRENGREVTELPADFYSTTAFTDKLLDYLAAPEAQGRPFFGYLALTAPHYPLHAPAAAIAEQAGRYDGGWDLLRARRFVRMQQLGLIPATAKLPPRHQDVPAWHSLSAAEQARAARAMEVYAAMVTVMDREIGRLLDTLEQRGELANTLVVFMSDNGPEGMDIARGPFGGDWLQRFDNSLDNMGLPGSYISYGPGWGQLGAAPFRLFKGFPTQGGITSPLIVWGQGIVGEQRTGQFAQATDITPTLLAAAGLEATAEADSLPLQGQSLWPLWTGQTLALDTPGAGWELFNHRAVRQGDWKLVRLDGRYASDWQLFNLAEDPGELKDLAAQHPERVAALKAQWQQYQADNGVLLAEQPRGYGHPAPPMPTGNRPPGNMPPGNMPPGNMPPGNMPPGNMPAGNLPPAQDMPGPPPAGSPAP